MFTCDCDFCKRTRTEISRRLWDEYWQASLVHYNKELAEKGTLPELEYEQFMSFPEWLGEYASKPCINCGQAEGEVYSGPPHDHVCPDCGREKPYIDIRLCAYCRAEPRIHEGDFCRKCMKYFEDWGND